MAFVFSAIFALLAVCSLTYADPNIVHTAAVNAAAANAAAANVAAAKGAAAIGAYYSPWLPSSSWYTPALLDLPPFFMPCDCDLSCLIDPLIEAEIQRLAAVYGLLPCNLQQWERIIHDQMPNLDYQSTINMIAQMAAAMRREQLRRGLINSPEFNEFCLGYSSHIAGAMPSPVLVKRDPLYTAADAIAAQNAAAANAALTNAAVTHSDFMPLYYNMMYMYDHIMPYLSPKLQMDIQNAVFSNTPLEYFDKAFSLTQRLKLNARGMVSNMIDLTPGSINDPIPLVY